MKTAKHFNAVRNKLEREGNSLFIFRLPGKKEESRGGI